MSSLDLHQLCEGLSFICKVTLRYLALRLQHLNLRGRNVFLMPYKGSEVGTHFTCWRKSMEGRCDWHRSSKGCWKEMRWEVMEQLM